MEKPEAYFIQHCDNENCDLGSFQYTCPHCEEVGVCYDTWWEQDDIMDGKPSETIYCSKCEGRIQAFWDKENYIFYVDKVE